MLMNLGTWCLVQIHPEKGNGVANSKTAKATSTYPSQEVEQVKTQLRHHKIYICAYSMCASTHTLHMLLWKQRKKKVALGYLMQQILERYVQQRLLQTGCRDIPLCISHQVRQVGRTTEL